MDEICMSSTAEYLFVCVWCMELLVLIVSCPSAVRDNFDQREHHCLLVFERVQEPLQRRQCGYAVVHVLPQASGGDELHCRDRHGLCR